VALSEEIGDRTSTATALSASAGVLEDLNRRKESIARLERAASIYRRDDNGLGLAVVLLQTAEARMNQGDLIAARHGVEESMAIARRVENKEILATGLVVTAVIQRSRGELRRAARVGAEAVTLARSIDYRAMLLVALSEQADLLAMGGDFEAAQKLTQEAKGVAEKTGSPAVGLDLALADYDSKRDRPAQAAARIRDILVHLNESEQSDLRALAFEILARALLAQGKAQEAQEEMQRATAAAPPEHKFADRLRMMLTLARVEAANGQRSTAEQRIERALKEAQSARWVDLELEARLALIEILPTARQHALARSLHDDAVRRGFSYIAKKVESLLQR
jgi:tetratricopeptide (TPR) repeat protein